MMGKKKYKKLKKEIFEGLYESTQITDTRIDKIYDKIKSLEEKIKHIDERTMALDNVKVNQILNKTKQLDEKVKILMDRTSTNYSEPAYTEATCIQNVYNRMANRGATREELDTFKNLIHKYNALEYTANKEAKVTCSTCKHSEKVNGCEYSDICKNYSDWEEK